MTKKGTFITASLLIALSLPAAQAVAILPGSITVVDLAKETLAKKTLGQVQTSAAAVADEAGQLRTMIGPNAIPGLHLVELAALKGEVNQMGREIGSLEAEGESLAPWERQAVDKVLPRFQATAANTERAIDYFNENRDHLWTEVYRNYTDRIAQDSEQIAKILRNYLRYEKLREREIQMEAILRPQISRHL